MRLSSRNSSVTGRIPPTRAKPPALPITRNISIANWSVLKALNLSPGSAAYSPHCKMPALGARSGHQRHAPTLTPSEDVTQGKPDPEVFLKAAAKVGGIPEHSVVFEDAHVGIQAGLTANMKVIAVATTHPVESLGDAHLVCENLNNITADTVLELLS
jgi:beta-phosphoglucomutase-like phosphatase (HAD superfamily)